VLTASGTLVQQALKAQTILPRTFFISSKENARNARCRDPHTQGRGVPGDHSRLRRA
jgi:hypothetical protein